MAPDSTFASFLARSLAVLEDESPSIHRSLCERLRGEGAHLRIEEEDLDIRVIGDSVRVIPAAELLATEFASDRATLLDLVSGRCSFLDAVLAERVRLRGRVEDLVAFYDSLLLYLHGAVRSPAMPALLDEFAAATAARTASIEGVQAPAAQGEEPCLTCPR